MVSEIQSKLSSPLVSRSDVPVSNAAPGPVQAHPVQEAEHKPLITPIPKANIQFDPEKAQKNLQEAIQKLNDMMKDSGRALSFSMDVKLGYPIVFVKNMANGEVVRQIPNDVVVRVAHGLEDFKGLLHNKSS